MASACFSLLHKDELQSNSQKKFSNQLMISNPRLTEFSLYIFLFLVCFLISPFSPLLFHSPPMGGGEGEGKSRIQISFLQFEFKPRPLCAFLSLIFLSSKLLLASDVSKIETRDIEQYPKVGCGDEKREREREMCSQTLPPVCQH